MAEVRMVKIALVVPVYKNLQGALELFESVDVPVYPIVVPNWRVNIGVSAGWNHGLDTAIRKRCDLALVCNDDIILEPGTIQKLQASVWNTGYDLATAVNTRDVPTTPHVEHSNSPDFACFMVQPEQFTNKFGWFDENFTPAYFEDNDMHRRMILAGGSAVCRTDAGMYHKGSVTQNWGGERVVSHEMFRANSSYYQEKWGGLPGAETYDVAFNEMIP